MRVAEIERVGTEQWNMLLDGEQQAFGGLGEELSWAEKERHVCVVDEHGRLLAHAGAMVARVTVGGGEEFPVVGIGGVLVTHRMRGRGLARMVLEAIMGLAVGIGPDRAMLFCREGLVPFYGEFGFEPIIGPVRPSSPAGRSWCHSAGCGRRCEPGPGGRTAQSRCSASPSETGRGRRREGTTADRFPGPSQLRFSASSGSAAPFGLLGVGHRPGEALDQLLGRMVVAEMDRADALVEQYLRAVRPSGPLRGPVCGHDDSGHGSLLPLGSRLLPTHAARCG